MTTENKTPDHLDTPDGDRVGHIETHGVDYIPHSERHGKPRELFTLWATPNVSSYLAIISGSVLIAMGLSLWQAIGVTLVGSLFAIATGVVAVTGPKSGTPSQVVTRAMYGVRGNRVAIAVNGWFVSVCYIAIGWSAASLVGFALVERMGIAASTPVKVVVIVAIASLTVLLAVYGQATIAMVYGPLSIALAVVFLAVGGYVFAGADYSYTPAEPLTGVALWATLVAGVTLIASGPLSYTISSDFARYLPEDTSPVAVACYTALGSILPAVVVGSVGVLAATAVDMSDPEVGLQNFGPGWLHVIFLVAVIVGVMSNNTLTTYSAGLAMQSVGVPVSRAVAVLLTGVIAAAMTMYALLVSDFLASVAKMLSLMVTLVGPIMAVYMADIFLRRNQYDGQELSDVTPDSKYWFTGGVNLAGAIAVITAAVLSLLSAYAPGIFTGPIAESLNGFDLSLPMGMIVAAVLYVVLYRVLYGKPEVTR